MKYADDQSGFGNAVLYQMCSDKPLHTDVDTIAGEIWLIGRSYSAAIVRKAGNKIKKGEDFYKSAVGPDVRDSGIDKWISSVALVSRPTPDNVESILLCHKNVTDLFQRITGYDKRSLASKYLHFHVPKAFFIFDSIANRRIRELLRGTKLHFRAPEGFDDEYAAFVTRCIYYRDNVLEKQLGVGATPRRVDMALLNYGP